MKQLQPRDDCAAGKEEQCVHRVYIYTGDTGAGVCQCARVFPKVSGFKLV